MKYKTLLKKLKEAILEGSIDNVEELALKLNVPESECIKALRECGVDIVNESVVDELCESVPSLDDNKRIVLEHIQREKSLKDIALEMEISELEVAGIIKKLKEDGYNILNVIKNGEAVAVNIGNDSLKKNNIYNIDNVKGDFTFLAISDTRLCSYYQQLGILNEIYMRAFEEGASFVLHMGDISEGIYKRDLLKDTIFMHDTYSQANYIAQNYPYIEGMPTYFITGEHDDTHISVSKENIGKLIAQDRKDMIYLGQSRAAVKVGNTNILMRHPKGKVAYTISYKSQRHINAMRSEDKVNIILNGHWCYMDEYVLRKINQYSVPSVVAQTPEMDFLDTPNTVGYYLVNVKLDEKGNFDKTTYRRVCYYETVKDEDYRRVKPLYLTSKSDEYKKVLSLRGGK